MIQIALIAIAAGAASTLLFASVSSGSLLSIPLFNLAPLPILIAGIGWGHLAALGAALVASLALAAAFGGHLFLSFLIGVGLPAWWLSYLALLARPVASAGAAAQVEWYPVGRIVVWAGLVSALVVMLVILMVASDSDDLRSALHKSLSTLLRTPQLDGDGSPVGDGAIGGTFMQILMAYPDRVLPPAAAVLTTLMQAFTLWLAARVVNMSGLLRRPWPDLTAMRFPPGALTLLGAALAVSFVPGLIGIVGSIVTAALLTAYALLGLAVMHALTRLLSGRGFILGSLYGGIAIFGWPLLLMSLLGIADTRLDLRARMPRLGPPTPPS
jgi:hypothetical protein